MNGLDDITKGKWQWKSNKNPWSKSEEEQWTSYPLDHNYLIEKAYYNSEKEADLGDYIVSLEHRVQMKKGNTTSQRPIRKINWMEDIEELSRSERYLKTETPKTINKVFGSLGDFVHYFSKRSPESLDFRTQFDELEKSNDIKGLNLQLLPKIVDCLQKEFVKSVSKHSGIKTADQISIEEVGEQLILSFKKDFENFEEFYKLILRAYTMSTFLYRNLNKYLRNESWTEIDNLLPYAICLCKAFFNLELISNSNQALLNMKASQGTSSMVLYRGTSFDESSLRAYNPQTLQNFSWNSVTSTSTKKKVAENFMYKSADLKAKKYPVMFVIEVPLDQSFTETEYLRWMDVKQYSVFKGEDEVILAPGSAFDLQQVWTNKDKITIIMIKLRNEVRSLAYRGSKMQGALQSEMMTDRQMKIMCLEGEELYEALQSISGNQLIEEIEFCLCTFDKRSLGEMTQTLPNMKSAKALKFVTCVYKDQDSAPIVLMKKKLICNIAKVEVLGRNNFYKIFSFEDEEDSQYWMFLRQVNINLISSLEFGDQELHELSFQGLKCLTDLTSLTLDFAECEKITDEGINSLCSQGLESLIHLTSLTLSFSLCDQITNKGVNTLSSQALRHLTRLTQLKLDFSECSSITNEGVGSLCLQGLKHLTNLTSFELFFTLCKQITDSGIQNLCSQGLKYLPHLTFLNLAFDGCFGITDAGLRSLCCDGLKYLTHLTSFNLDLSYCSNLTDEGLNDFGSEGLIHLTNLRSLNLGFADCSKLTDKGLNNLGVQGLKHLTLLTYLNLNFSECDEVTDEGIDNLCSQSLEPLTQLPILNFNSKSYPIFRNGSRLDSPRYISSVAPSYFIRCQRTLQSESQFEGDEDPLTSASSKYSLRAFNNPSELINKFKLIQVLLAKMNNSPNTNKKLTCLEELTLEDIESLQRVHQLTIDFVGWYETTDETLNMWSYGFRYLAHLTSLNLNLSVCNQVTDKGIDDICSQGLQHLSQLCSLNLDFTRCDRITDKGFSALCLHGLKPLLQLTSLNLIFSQSQITAEGMKSLCYHGLKYLTHLKSLSLDFHECYQITDEEVSILSSKGLQQLTNLASLTLNFSKCSKITDEGINSLSFYAFKSLSSLAAFNLNFSYCEKITIEGINNLCLQGLKSLPLLMSLHLEFSRCPQITSENMQSLCSQGLESLAHLSSLSLSSSLQDPIIDKEINILFSGLRNLKNLTSLDLNFSNCPKITNEGLDYLCSQGLVHLTQLTSLNLSFYECEALTDETIDRMCEEGLKSLIRLTSLKLSFSHCLKITDEGVNNLCSQGLKHLTHLTSLSLDFSSCSQISDFTMKNILRVLRYYGFISLEN